MEECSRLWNGQCSDKDNKLLGNCIDIDCEFKQLQRLKQENELLKIELDFQQKTNLKQQDISRDYWEALEEIREDMEKDTTCESRECGCDDYAECLNCIKETILNKINEVISG